MAKAAKPKRTKPAVLITLSPEALERIDAYAQGKGQSRSAAIEQLIRDRTARHA